MSAPWISSFFFSFFFFFSFNRRQFAIASSSLPPSEGAPVYGIPTTANRSTSWTNDESSLSSISFPDGSMYRAILRDETNSSICGFFCIQGASCTSYLFAILLNRHDPVVIWSANRDYPVRNGAILNLTATNELILYDVDGSKVWTTNTTGKSIAGVKLSDNGNLVLFDGDNSMIWQSFDHPTDCLVQGQKLFQGQKLIPSVSSTNWAAQKDSYSLQVTNKGLFAYVESNPPLVYYRHLVNGTDTDKQTRYVEFFNGNLSFFNFSTEPSRPDSVIPIPQKFPLQYMKLMPNGHLTVFEYDSSVGSVGWMAVADLLTGDLGECFYPLVCGRNGICSGNQECSCPRSSFPGMDSFRAVNDSEPNMGCSQVTPLTCNATQNHTFIEIKNVKYFTYTVDIENVDLGTCTQACLNNCSCKAALFEYGDPSHSNGNCYLPTELFTMTKNFDKSLPEESWHLLRVFERCWEHGTLLSIVDRYSEDMQIHGTEVVETMKVASWCLQTDFRKRPSMSVVIKVLTGVINVESNLDYKFSYTSQQKTTVKHGESSLPLSPSILSGPR
ncbi:unnamed protein product [Lactuca virosa]|uniref:Bulb-type lectin domain-containing protein n=1 Tax=Lactuca virosa TaxID=75947 RepID=A0AAU9MXH0_9ASTR|nr:unnamed protein product [Lactuca virosa]